MGIAERKEREKEQRREEILDAAQKIFFTKGLQSATMDEIAAAAELSKGTLYLYFNSKEDLYLAVLLRGLQHLSKMFQEVVAKNLPVIETIRELQRAYVLFFRRHVDYFRMLDFFETPQFHKQVSEEIKLQCHAATEALWQMVIKVIERGMTQGMIKKEMNARQTAVMFWVCINSLLRYMDRDDHFWKEKMAVDLHEMLEVLSNLLLEAMLTSKGRRTIHQSQLTPS